MRATAASATSPPPGPDRLIAVAKRPDLEKAARGQDDPGQDQGGPATQAMRGRLKTPAGITAYRQRGHIAGTPHDHIKHNMAFRQLSMRGKRKAAAEWTLACTVHNLLKALTSESPWDICSVEATHRPPHPPTPSPAWPADPAPGQPSQTARQPIPGIRTSARPANNSATARRCPWL
jgi:hypothetical protein